jgi:hypothetical protein
MTDDNKTTEQPAPFKSYEDMTPEERLKRAEEVFVWKEGDIDILDAGDPSGDQFTEEEEELLGDGKQARRGRLRR